MEPIMPNRNYVGGYFDWLCDLINLEEERYGELIRTLYLIKFHWVFDLDVNRNRDGLLLREEFAEYCPDGIGTIGDVASVLEVLIGLAKQMDFILDDEDRGDRTRFWFWEFIHNLSLDRYTNDYIEKLSPTEYIDEQLDQINDICNNWMNRTFDYDGKGSPFPLNNPLSDQTRLDMIRQLNAYILEKHMYEDELL